MCNVSVLCHLTEQFSSVINVSDCFLWAANFESQLVPCQFLRAVLMFLQSNFGILPCNGTCTLLNPFKYMVFDHPVSSFDAK